MEVRIMNKMYRLSTEGYFFEYRRDQYSRFVIHATLYKGNAQAPDTCIAVDDIIVERDDIKMSHQKVIDYFEIWLTLGIID